MPRITAPHLSAGSLNSGPQPVLTAEGLVLRPWSETDADIDALMTAYEDPAIQQWHVRRIETRDEAREILAGWIESWSAETGAHWAVTDPDGGSAGPEVVGRVALQAFNLADGLAEIGYWVTPGARGRGVAVRAAVALTEWALTDLGLHRVGLGHSVRNAASCRVAEKAGFVAEGTVRSAWLHADGWHDVHKHARIQGDR